MLNVAPYLARYGAKKPASRGVPFSTCTSFHQNGPKGLSSFQTRAARRAVLGDTGRDLLVYFFYFILLVLSCLYFILTFLILYFGILKTPSRRSNTSKCRRMLTYNDNGMTVECRCDKFALRRVNCGSTLAQLWIKTK